MFILSSLQPVILSVNCASTVNPAVSLSWNSSPITTTRFYYKNVQTLFTFLVSLQPPVSEPERRESLLASRVPIKPAGSLLVCVCLASRPAFSLLLLCRLLRSGANTKTNRVHETRSTLNITHRSSRVLVCIGVRADDGTRNASITITSARPCVLSPHRENHVEMTNTWNTSFSIYLRIP